MADPWHPLVSYREGERCRYLGTTYQAKFDLIRGIKPVGALSEKFWRPLPSVSVPKSSNTNSTNRKQPSGYIRRDMRWGD